MREGEDPFVLNGSENTKPVKIGTTRAIHTLCVISKLKFISCGINN